jgi:hypothetical protein
LQIAKDADTEDALPLLAFALRELYELHGKVSKRLTLADYQRLGSEAALNPLENAVRRAADRVMTESKPSGDDLTALREAFIPAMVRINDQGEYARQPAEWDHLSPRAYPLLQRPGCRVWLQ